MVEKIYAGIKTVLKNAAVQKRLIESGYTPGGTPPPEFAKFVKVETEKYGKHHQDDRAGEELMNARQL